MATTKSTPRKTIKASASTPRKTATATPKTVAKDPNAALAADPRITGVDEQPKPSADSPSPDTTVEKPKVTLPGRVADDAGEEAITSASAQEVLATAGDKNPGEPQPAVTRRLTTAEKERKASGEAMVSVTVPRAFRFCDDTHSLIDYPAGIYEMPRAHAEDSFTIANGVTINK